MQEVFPVEYDNKYDKDLQLLVWEFLSRLEKILPVPDLGQVKHLSKALQVGSTQERFCVVKGVCVCVSVVLFQTVSWLSSAPSVLDECVESLSQPDDLKTLLQHLQSLENVGTQGEAHAFRATRFKCVFTVP